MASNFVLGNFELNEEISLSDLMLMPTQNLIDVKKDDTTCSTKRRFSIPMSNAESNKKILNAVSHALQPPKPTITAYDTDNTATSVKKMSMIARKIVQLMKIVHVP